MWKAKEHKSTKITQNENKFPFAWCSWIFDLMFDGHYTTIIKCTNESIPSEGCSIYVHRKQFSRWRHSCHRSVHNIRPFVNNKCPVFSPCFVGNMCAQEPNKVQTKRANITGVQYLRAYHQVMANEYFIHYPLFILLPHYLCQLNFLPPPPPPPPPPLEYDPPARPAWMGIKESKTKFPPTSTMNKAPRPPLILLWWPLRFPVTHMLSLRLPACRHLWQRCTFPPDSGDSLPSATPPSLCISLYLMAHLPAAVQIRGRIISPSYQLLLILTPLPGVHSCWFQQWWCDKSENLPPTLPLFQSW